MSRSLNTVGRGEPDRAVIDIGSNTVRLVIYEGCARAPQPWFNEKVTARLGRDLAKTGRMPDDAMEQAVEALGRYVTLIDDLDITSVKVVATAAVRDALNGPEFLERVRGLGLSPRLLSGEEEARSSAFGVIGAFPGAQGTVADLGGGSLELVVVEHGGCHDGVSLPLGTLRLPALRQRGTEHFQRTVRQAMSKAPMTSGRSSPLYMVGGTWRALGAFAMRRGKYPSTDPHGLSLSPESADQIAKSLTRISPERIALTPGVSASRASHVPHAAAMLRVMLAELKPDAVIFSSWGVREGLLYQRLEPAVQAQDPLLAAVADFAESRGGSPKLASRIADWTRAIFPEGDPENERLRLASGMLALAARHVEPNLRLRHGYDWAIDKRWAGTDMSGRAMMAAAVLAACGKVSAARDLERILDPRRFGTAIGWGLAVRLCCRLGGGSQASLQATSLKVADARLTLRVQSSHRQLISDKVIGDCDMLAQWLGRRSRVELVPSAS